MHYACSKHAEEAAKNGGTFERIPMPQPKRCCFCEPTGLSGPGAGDEYRVRNYDVGAQCPAAKGI